VSALNPEQIKALINLQQIQLQQKNPQYHFSQKFSQSQMMQTAGRYNEIL